MAAAAPFKVAYYSWLTAGYTGWRGLAAVFAFFWAAALLQRWVAAGGKRTCGGVGGGGCPALCTPLLSTHARFPAEQAACQQLLVGCVRLGAPTAAGCIPFPPRPSVSPQPSDPTLPRLASSPRPHLPSPLAG